MSVGHVVRRLKHYSTSLRKSTLIGDVKKNGKKPKPEFSQKDIPSATDPFTQEKWREGK